jgi:hypothetical protein
LRWVTIDTIKAKNLVTDSNRCPGAHIKGRAMIHPPIFTRTTLLCVAFLASATTLVLRPDTLVGGVAVGVLVVCLGVVAFRALRHASRRVDRILAEELASAEQSKPRARRTAA